jgi:hypothetical protein
MRKTALLVAVVAVISSSTQVFAQGTITQRGGAGQQGLGPSAPTQPSSSHWTKPPCLLAASARRSRTAWTSRHQAHSNAS